MKPFLITGAKRTGKTLLAMLLDAHPNLSVSQFEDQVWNADLHKFGDLANPANLEKCLAYLAHRLQERGYSPDINYIRGQFLAGVARHEHLFSITHREYMLRRKKRRWGAHSGQFIRHMDKIMELLPTARVIHMLRDPRDTLAAERERLRRQGRRQKPGLLQIVLDGWLESKRLANYYQSLYLDRYRVITYEKLVGDPANTLKTVCEFIEEKSGSIQQMNDHLREIRTNRGRIAYGTLSKRYCGFYPEELTPREINYIQWYLRTAGNTNPYRIEAKDLSYRERLRLQMIDIPWYLSVKILRTSRQKLTL